MKKKNNDELEKVYLTFAKPLYFYLLKLTGSHSMAEELVQETFYRATLSLDLYEDKKAKSWLFKVARHAYLDEWRKRQRWKWMPFYELLANDHEFQSPYGIPEEALAEKEVIQEIKDIMRLLPESYRTIIYLREYEQFSYEELSETMDLSLNQVKVNLYRARQRFKQIADRLGKDFERGNKNGME